MVKRDIAGLDAVRTALVFLGVVIHAAGLIGGQAWYQWATVASHAFRMEAFFAISGLLAAASLARSDPERWWAGRAVAIGVPLLAGYVLLVLPMALWSAWGSAPASTNLGLQHLWFLVVLLALNRAAAELHEQPAFGARLSELARRLRAYGNARHLTAATIAALATWSIAAVLLKDGLETFLLEPVFASEPAALSSLATETVLMPVKVLLFLPFFLLGMLVFSLGPDRGLIGDRQVLGAAALLGAVPILWLHARGVDVFPYNEVYSTSFVAKAVLHAGHAILAPVGCMAAILTAYRIRHVGHLAREGARSAYSIYLFHYPILAVLIIPNLPGPRESSGGMLLAVAGAVAFSYALHLATMRSVWLSFLFNGRGAGEAVEAARAMLARLGKLRVRGFVPGDA